MTKLPPYISQGRRSAHQAHMRRRENWMPKLQHATAANAWNRYVFAQTVKAAKGT